MFADFSSKYGEKTFANFPEIYQRDIFSLANFAVTAVDGRGREGEVGGVMNE